MTSPLAVATLVIAHAALGIAMSQYSILAFVHALVTVAIALRFAGSWEPEWIGGSLAYIAGSEVLWRMTTDRLPWELGKYAVILVSVVAIVRIHGLRALVVPSLFFALLLPSAVLTVLDFDAEEARQQISFNLSGPLALVICAWFFRLTTLSVSQFQRILLALIAPVVGIAGIAAFGILTAPDILFNTESNFATSGGFGPNQVSAMMGLGALFAFFCLFVAGGGWSFRILMFSVMSWLAIQSALTFSRGGLFAAGGAAVTALLCLIRDRNMRLRMLLVAAVALIVAWQAVWPRLDEFTEGTITERFTEMDVTRRDALGEEDLLTWAENPIFGVGPGRSSLSHDDRIITHTEFTRVLAEHGSLGAAATIALLLIGVQNVRRAQPGIPQAVAAAMFVWSCLFMLNSAMRTVAPSLLFGLSCTCIRTTARPRRAPTARLAPRGAAAPVPSWRTP